MNLYLIQQRPIWWTIFCAIISGNFNRLDKAIDYLGRRLNRELYRKQLRMWELDRKLAEIDKRIKACGGSRKAETK